MRDPKRIYTVIQELHHLWAQCPDLRLCQLLAAIAGPDPFYMEDEVLLERMRAWKRHMERTT